jgi:hypothetical protein
MAPRTEPRIATRAAAVGSVKHSAHRHTAIEPMEDAVLVQAEKGRVLTEFGQVTDVHPSQHG